MRWCDVVTPGLPVLRWTSRFVFGRVSPTMEGLVSPSGNKAIDSAIRF
jgi:hypothetical protein